MPELTSELFERGLHDLRGHIDQQVSQSEQRVNDRIDQLARSVAQAFEKQNEYLDQRFDLIERRFERLEKDLDVRGQVQNLEKRLRRLEERLSE